MKLEKFLENYIDNTTILGMNVDTFFLVIVVLIAVCWMAYCIKLAVTYQDANKLLAPFLTMFACLPGILVIPILVSQNNDDYLRDYVYKLDGTKAELIDISRYEGTDFVNEGYILTAELNGKREVVKVESNKTKIKKDLITGSKPYVRYVNLNIDSKKYPDLNWMSGTYIQEIHVSKDYKFEELIESK